MSEAANQQFLYWIELNNSLSLWVSLTQFQNGDSLNTRAWLHNNTIYVLGSLKIQDSL